MQALYFTPNGASADKAIGALPSLPVPVNYPQYNSAVLLPLQGPQYSAQVWSTTTGNKAADAGQCSQATFEVVRCEGTHLVRSLCRFTLPVMMQVLLAGGSSEYCANAHTPAGETSWLVDVTPGADHKLQKETLAFPRIVRSQHLSYG